MEKVLGLIEDKKIDKDLLLLTDSRSTCESIINNTLPANKQKYIVKIKERLAKLRNQIKDEGEGKNRKVVIG